MQVPFAAYLPDRGVLADRLGRGARAIALASVALLAAAWPFTGPPPLHPLTHPYPQPPIVAVPEAENSLAVYLEAGKLFKEPAEFRTFAHDVDQPYTAAELAVAHGNAAALARFHQAIERPKLQLAPPNGYAKDDTFVLFNRLRWLAAASAAVFVDERRQGHWAPALQAATDVLDAYFKFAISPQTGFIALSLGNTLARQTLDALDGLRAHLEDVPGPALEAFARDLDRIEARRLPFEVAILGEAEALYRLETDPRAVYNPRTPYDWLDCKLDKSGWWYDECHARLARMAELVARRDWNAIDDEFYSFGHVSDLQALRIGVGALEHPIAWKGFIHAASYKDFSALRVAMLAEARFSGLRVRVALDRYRRAHGKPPATLAELVPAYLAAVPRDPCAPDRPLSYADGRLWSVGFDGVDEGGRVPLPYGLAVPRLPDKSRPTPRRDDRGDILL